ncbi:MAG: 4-(cytidine 5'-diphospho)-2-C-methyl-D-erythritol kinase [Clostridia bacterium]|nr:4-(cytidine 5'-diphospho)-2-C-methyl-D-erythritol kinase [Clostridia bacterium]
MRSAKVRVHAKINLTLEIVGRENGFHQLDSLVASIELCDTVALRRRKGALSNIVMHGQGSESIPPERNNALKAAEEYSSRFHTDGAEITVWKDIPIGGGLGGSSADIAGVLLGMQKLYGAATDEELFALADELGSDVRYMMRGGYARMQGKGETVTPIDGIKQPFWLLLLCPKTSVSAGECYRKYDEMNATDAPTGATERAIAGLKADGVFGLKDTLYNALYAPAASLCGEVKRAMEEAESFSPIAAVMTGSGSAVAAVFENREFCDWAKSRYRGKFRAIVVKTVDPTKKQPFWTFPFALKRDEQE